MNNLDLLNGIGHGLSLNDGSFGNVQAVGGNGNGGYGQSIIRQTGLQVHANATLTSILAAVTGLLGDMSMGADVPGTFAGAGFNAVVSYAALAGTPLGMVGFSHSLGAVIAVEGTGVGSTSTVIVPSAVYAVNELRGQVVRFLNGAAALQQRVIVSNTAASITVGAAFNPAPSAAGGEAFLIETYEPTKNRIEKVTP